MDDRTIGQRLRAARQSQRVTQTGLADAVGVSRESIRKWENGQVHVDWPTLERWVSALGLVLSVELLADGGDLTEPQRAALDVARRVLPTLSETQVDVLARVLRSFEAP